MLPPDDADDRQDFGSVIARVSKRARRIPALKRFDYFVTAGLITKAEADKARAKLAPKKLVAKVVRGKIVP